MNLMDSIDKIFFKPNLVTVNNSQFEEEFVTHVKDEVKKPKFYKVLLHNDDYTTMEFVLHVLKKIFGKSHEEAERIMFKVHYEGVGVCGVYTFEVAETKVSQVQREANENGHPLQCSYEEE